MTRTTPAATLAATTRFRVGASSWCWRRKAEEGTTSTVDAGSEGGSGSNTRAGPDVPAAGTLTLDATGDTGGRPVSWTASSARLRGAGAGRSGRVRRAWAGSTTTPGAA